MFQVAILTELTSCLSNVISVIELVNVHARQG